MDYIKITAICAAIVSTIALAWTIGSDIWKETNNDGSLKAHIVGTKDDTSDKKSIDMEIKVVNEGVRPIVLQDWCIRKTYNTGGSELSCYGEKYNLPVRLEEKQLFVIKVKTTEPYNDYFGFTNSSEIVFIDSVGQETIVNSDEIEWWHFAGSITNDPENLPTSE